MINKTFAKEYKYTNRAEYINEQSFTAEQMGSV